MVMNCPDEELEFLSEILKSLNVTTEKSNVRQSPQSSIVESTVKDTFTKLTTPFFDPFAKKENQDVSFEEDDELHLDPMYTSLNHFHQLTRATGTVNIKKENESSLFDVAKQWIPYSSTVAIAVAALAEENSRWAKHDFLNKATFGMKKLIELNENIPIKVLEKVPTEVLLKFAEENDDCSGETNAVERILRAGCDRERFFEDAEYREDSLLGLIMTKNKSMIIDIQEVAKQFNVPLWKLNMSLIEYALTEEDVTPSEAKDLIKEYNLRESLWEDQPSLYQTLRQSVLALLPGKDVNRLKLFLSFFRPPESEVYFFKALPSILKVDSNTKLKEFLKGDERTILAWTALVASKTTVDDEFIDLLPFFKKLPNAAELVAKLTSYLRISPDLSSPRRIRLLFYLNDKKADLVIDQISSDMSPHEEESFWNEVLDGWDSTEDKYEVRLLDRIRRRLHNLKSKASTDSISTTMEVQGEENQKFEMRRRGR